jgi:hypothetical protein
VEARKGAAAAKEAVAKEAVAKAAEIPFASAGLKEKAKGVSEQETEGATEPEQQQGGYYKAPAQAASQPQQQQQAAVKPCAEWCFAGSGGPEADGSDCHDAECGGCDFCAGEQKEKWVQDYFDHKSVEKPLKWGDGNGGLLCSENGCTEKAAGLKEKVAAAEAQSEEAEVAACAPDSPADAPCWQRAVASAGLKETAPASEPQQQQAASDPQQEQAAPGPCADWCFSGTGGVNPTGDCIDSECGGCDFCEGGQGESKAVQDYFDHKSTPTGPMEFGDGNGGLLCSENGCTDEEKAKHEEAVAHDEQMLQDIGEDEEAEAKAVAEAVGVSGAGSVQLEHTPQDGYGDDTNARYYESEQANCLGWCNSMFDRIWGRDASREDCARHSEMEAAYAAAARRVAHEAKLDKKAAPRPQECICSNDACQACDFCAGAAPARVAHEARMDGKEAPAAKPAPNKDARLAKPAPKATAAAAKAAAAEAAAEEAAKKKKKKAKAAKNIPDEKEAKTQEKERARATEQAEKEEAKEVVAAAKAAAKAGEWDTEKEAFSKAEEAEGTLRAQGDAPAKTTAAAETPPPTTTTAAAEPVAERLETRARAMHQASVPAARLGPGHHKDPYDALPEAP